MEAPVLQPCEIQLDENHIQTMTKEIEEAANMELPEGDDGDDF